MLWLGLLSGVLALAVALLLIKIYLLRKAAKEIGGGFAEKLTSDSNTLISLSSGDRRMRSLAVQVNEQLRLLRRERRRYQSGNLELREAIANISHDLRTPLTAICGYLDLMRREELPEPAARYLEMIENRTRLLRQLTEELLRYAVLASNEGEAHYEEVALGAALEEGLSAHYAALKASGITPDISIPEKKLTAWLDRNLFSRILSNILGNAIKYSDGDLSVVLKDSGEMVFSNSAKDLTPVTAGKLFDRFFTVETGRGGAGLGLSIAKLLTERMGGGIEAAYRDGRLFITLRFDRTI